MPYSRWERRSRGGTLLEGKVKVSELARSGTVVAVVETLGAAAAGPVLADTSNFGRKVYRCASMMLPYDLTDELGGS
jgi:hypothetical protein